MKAYEGSGDTVQRVPNLGNRHRRLTSHYGLNINLTSGGLALFNDDQSPTSFM